MNPRVARLYIGRWVNVCWTEDGDKSYCSATLRVLRVNRDELVSQAGRRVPLSQITSLEALPEPRQ